MSKPWSMQIGDINLTAGSPASSARPSEETPFRMLLLANFSGRGEAAALAGRRPVLIDRDNFDAVMAKLDVQVRLPAAQPGAAPLVLRFKELDDFHPDRLFERLEMFGALRDLRRRLGNPKTFAAAADEVRSWAAPPAAEAPAAPAAPAAPPPPSDPAAILDQILGGYSPAEPAPAQQPAAVDWNAYLRRVVAPYLVPGAHPDEGELIGRVDRATA